MKKVLKIILIAVLCIVVIVGSLAIWQWNNIKALFLSLNYSAEEIDTLYIENEQKINSILSDFTQGEMRGLSEEEKAQLLTGELTSEQALEIIKNVSKPKTDESVSENSNSKKYSDELYNLIAQIYLLRDEYTNELTKLESEAISVKHNMSKEQKTIPNKLKYIELYTGKAVALEKQCDAKMESIIKKIETELKNTGNDTALISQIRALYASEKEIKKSQLLNKYSKYLK